MNHKRGKSRKRARCYGDVMGPRDAGGVGWRRGNHASRFRVRDMSVRWAAEDEMDMDEVACIRVIMPEAPGHESAELFRVPVDEAFSRHSAAALERHVKDAVEESPLVAKVMANRYGDVEVILGEMLNYLRAKGIEAVCEAVEPLVERLSSRFVEMRLPTCPRCRSEVKWEDWVYGEGMCQGCVWDRDEEESLRSDWADSSR